MSVFLVNKCAIKMAQSLYKFKFKEIAIFKWKTAQKSDCINQQLATYSYKYLVSLIVDFNFIQVVHAMDRTSRVTDYRFIKEANGALTITNVMLEDDGKWQCEAENSRRYTENARPVKLVVLGE